MILKRAANFLLLLMQDVSVASVNRMLKQTTTATVNIITMWGRSWTENNRNVVIVTDRQNNSNVVVVVRESDRNEAVVYSFTIQGWYHYK